MSWLFSQVLVEAYLGDRSLDGKPCAQLNVMPTARAFLRNDKTIDVSRGSLFGLTCEVLTADRGEDLLTWYREDFLARTSPAQEKESDSTAIDRDSGKRCGELLAKFDPDTHSLRTAQCLLFEDSTECCAILPRWGMMRNGELSELPTPLGLVELRQSITTASASGSSQKMPTPNCIGYRSDGELALLGKTLSTEEFDALTDRACQSKKNKYRPQKMRTPLAPDGAKSGHGNLAHQVKKCPTHYGFSKDGRSNGPSGNELGRWVNREKVPTPTSSMMTLQDMEQARYAGNSGKRPDYQATVEKMPSPQARDWKDTGPTQGNRKSPNLGTTVGGSLNPEWVEWLMGWPIGWTDLEPLETARFQEWLQQHGEF